MKKTLLITFAALASSIVSANGNNTGTVYTETNNASANTILTFNRKADGTLQQGDSYATGGVGTGSGLGNQGALSIDGSNLIAVNAGSNSISVFTIGSRRLVLTDVANSGGTRPISVTQSRRLVYVLNAGTAQDPANIQGFFLTPNGKLVQIPSATMLLSTATPNPAQIQFSPDGRSLVVTEKGTNRVDLFELDAFGIPQSASYNSSNGTTPFGFDFDSRGRIFVAEAFAGMANASAMSSYRVDRQDDLLTISPSIPTTETAACWTLVSKDSRFAYTTNAGSGSVSGYRIGSNGALTLLNADGVTASTGQGSAPIDLASDNRGRFLYVLTNGAHAVMSYRINSNGSLTKIDEDGGLPAGLSGLVAR